MRRKIGSDIREQDIIPIDIILHVAQGGIVKFILLTL